MKKKQNIKNFKPETLIKMAAMTKRLMERNQSDYKRLESRLDKILAILSKKVDKKDIEGLHKKIDQHKKEIIRQFNSLDCKDGVCEVKEAEPDEIIEEKTQEVQDNNVCKIHKLKEDKNTGCPECFNEKEKKPETKEIIGDNKAEFKIVINEPDYLKKPISVIKELINEATFKLEKDSFGLLAMDPANVAMLDFKILSSACVEYNVKNPSKFNINIGTLHNVLKDIGKNDIIILEREGNNLIVTSKGSISNRNIIPLIEYEEKEQRKPELTFNCEAKVTSKNLMECIKKAGNIGESVLFELKKDKLSLFSKGDLSESNLSIDAKDSKGSGKCKYSIEYLSKMTKATKISEDVVVKFSTDYPLVLSYKIMDKLELGFILAPRVESD